MILNEYWNVYEKVLMLIKLMYVLLDGFYRIRKLLNLFSWSWNIENYIYYFFFFGVSGLIIGKIIIFV